MEGAPEQEVSPRADLVSSLVWVVFGGAVTIASWRMDRLEHLHINQYEIPGLVPGLLGAAITVLGALLALRAIRRGALGHAPAAQAPRRSVAAALAAMLLYSLVLVGHGIPFWLATGAFVSAFIFFFDRERQSALGRSTARQALLALVCGVATTAIVTFVFQDLFYVRLP